MKQDRLTQTFQALADSLIPRPNKRLRPSKTIPKRHDPPCDNKTSKSTRKRRSQIKNQKGKNHEASWKRTTNH